jgi:exopolysaccharide production protein ExoF
MLRTIVTSAGLVVALATGAIAQSESGSVIGTDDLLNVLVLEWDPILGEVKPWLEVSGEYRVRSDGTIAVPFAGRIQGDGRSADEIASDIVSALRERLALTDPPDVTVELTAQRPVIVTGDVRTPGPFDFSPGMLAIEAVGLAGGTGSLVLDQEGYLRELTSLRTSLQVLQDQELRLLARQARLQAELDGQTTMEPAAGLSEAPDWAAVIALEEQIMRIRADRLTRELGALNDQSALFAAEIQALDQKTVSLTEQRELANEAAENANSLVDRGLVAGQRLFETQNTLATIETQLLDVSTATLRARQNLASADRERISIQDLRKSEILESLQEVDSRLQDARNQIHGTLATIQAIQTGQPLEVMGEPAVTILRRAGDSLERIEDAAMLPLRPGDMVEVRQPIQFTANVATGTLPEEEVPAEVPQPTTIVTDEIAGVDQLSTAAGLSSGRQAEVARDPLEPQREAETTSSRQAAEEPILSEPAPTEAEDTPEPPLRPVGRPASLN